MKHRYDPQAVKSWIYPTNYPIRDYQINITTQCLFQNTLVALPTGLGKVSCFEIPSFQIDNDLDTNSWSSYYELL